MKKNVSSAVIKRLPRYYRCLRQLEEQKVAKISSKALADLLDITASQVRQDFCNFGGFGQQGYGYDVSVLKEALKNILGLNETRNIIVLGAGNIGKAISSYPGFLEDGFIFKAIFDIVVPEVKQDSLKIPIYYIDELEDYLEKNKIDIAVIATPMNTAQEVAERLVDAGITAIWNFATVNLDLPRKIVVENIFMSDSLFVLAHKINKNKGTL